MVSNKRPEVIIGCGHMTKAVVLGELLYATETWPAKQKDIRGLSSSLPEEHSGNKQDAAVCPAQ